MERDDLKKKYDEVMKENEELKQLLSKMDVSDFQFIDDSSDDSWFMYIIVWLCFFNKHYNISFVE